MLILAFKEKSNNKIVIEKVNDNAVNCDILVVDDGFQDCTAELTLKAGACVLRHLINMCYGVTIQSGYKYALLVIMIFWFKLIGMDSMMLHLSLN